MVDTATILQALDLDEVPRIADINGGTLDLAIALHNRFGSKIDVICLDSEGNYIEPTKDIRKYHKKLQKAGVEKSAIRLVTKQRMLKSYDVITTVGNFGSRYKIKHIKRLFDKALHPLSRVVIDIKKTQRQLPVFEWIWWLQHIVFANPR